MDKDLVLEKLESLRRCVERIRSKTPASAQKLREDWDLQDIIAVNLERAVQLCVDLGLHVVSDRGVSAPQTMAGTFAALERESLIDSEIAKRLAKAVGFRNIAVHAYRDIDWEIVHRIVVDHLEDFSGFARQILALLSD